MVSLFQNWLSGVAPASAPAPAVEQEEELDEVAEEAIGTVLQQYGVLLEYEHAQELLPAGTYVVPCFDSVLTWQGALFVRKGWYKGAVFKFKLQLPDDYPDKRPTVKFTSDVFHPLVDPKSGEVDLESWFPHWEGGNDLATFLLPHLERLFLKREYFDAGDGKPTKNEEAQFLFLEDQEAFIEKAAACARLSMQKVHENASGSSLHFTKGPAEAHETILEGLRNTEGLVWDERKSSFMDWFCDHYANKRSRVGVAQGETEVEVKEFEKGSPAAAKPS